jgi:hypothetical protein
MLYVLILRELTDPENKKIRDLERRNDIVFVTTSRFKDKHKNAKIYANLTEIEKRKVNYDVLSEIQKFGGTEIDGRSISNHLTIETAALWYYHRFRIYFLITNQQYEIAEINKNLIEATSALIFAESTIDPSQINVDQIEIHGSPKDTKSRISVSSLLQYGIVVLIRLLRSLFLSISKIEKKHYLCIDTINQYRNILSLDGSKTIFENAYTGYLYQKRGDQFGFIDQLIVPKFSGNDRYRFNSNHFKNHNRRTRINGERIMTSGLLSLSVISRLGKGKRQLIKKYGMLEESLGKKTIKSQILKEFMKLHNTSLFYLFKYLAYTKFFRHKKFSAIFTIDENSPNFKIILDAAKANNIYTVGYQHGSIHELHPNYNYSLSEHKQNPVPDLTITWGKKWNELLIEKGNYQRNMMAMAGQIRTDVIPNLIKNAAINKTSIFRDSKEKHLVLFASQPQRDPALRYKAAEDVIIACLNFETVHLIFKLHPRENDPEFYHDLASRYRLKNYTVSSDEELYVLLKVSDLVITCFSTVGSEALYFNKPLIILDHLKQDVQHYYRDGVAFQATDAGSLAELIRSFLDGDLITDPERLHKYLLESTGKIDGKTSERVWELITSNSVPLR